MRRTTYIVYAQCKRFSLNWFVTLRFILFYLVPLHEWNKLFGFTMKIYKSTSHLRQDNQEKQRNTFRINKRTEIVCKKKRKKTLLVRSSNLLISEWIACTVSCSVIYFYKTFESPGKTRVQKTWKISYYVLLIICIFFFLCPSKHERRTDISIEPTRMFT